MALIPAYRGVCRPLEGFLTIRVAKNHTHIGVTMRAVSVGV